MGSLWKGVDTFLVRKLFRLCGLFVIVFVPEALRKITAIDTPRAKNISLW